MVINKVKLKDVVTKANTGADAIRRAPIVEYDSGIKCLRTSDISNGKPYEQWGFCEVNELDYKRFSLKTNDILIARTGSIGKIFFVSADARAVFNNGIMRIRLDEKKAFPKFIYYSLANSSFIEYIKSIGAGSATRPNIKMEVALNYEICYYPLHTQITIAKILSIHDLLIENNNKRIKILEEMAQAIYTEWFVNFRFPGHEKVKFVDSELGKIPSTFQISKLSSVSEVNPENISSNYSDHINYISISDVTKGHITNIERLRFTEAPSRARRVVKNGDIIWSTVRPNLEGYALIINPSLATVVSTGFAVIRPTSLPYTYLYPFLTSQRCIQYFVNRAKGAAYPAVSQDDFKDMIINQPPNKLVVKYDATVNKFYQLINKLRLKNLILQNSRDLLIPKLISGEIDVSELDIELEEELYEQD